MAIIGKCWEILFGHDPPTGRPPDPGGDGGSCVGDDCDCFGSICECNPQDPTCTGGTLYTCDPTDGTCKVSQSGVSQGACIAAGCGQQGGGDDECACIIDAWVSESVITEGGQSSIPTHPDQVSETKTVTITYRCDTVPPQNPAAGTIAGIISSSFTADPGWNAWGPVNQDGVPGTTCTCNSIGGCPPVTLVAVRDSDGSEDVIPGVGDGEYVCEWFECSETLGGDEECLGQSKQTISAEVCLLYVTLFTAKHRTLLDCEDSGCGGDCTAYRCETITGCGTPSCYSVTVTPDEGQTCAQAITADAGLTTDSTCANIGCCLLLSCWWTCESGSDDCIECTKTTNTDCETPPVNPHTSQSDCHDNTNCDDCTRRWTCGTKSTVNTGQHCVQNSYPIGTTTGWALQDNCEPNCYNGYNCTTTAPIGCVGADDYGASYTTDRV